MTSVGDVSHRLAAHWSYVSVPSCVGPLGLSKNGFSIPGPDDPGRGCIGLPGLRNTFVPKRLPIGYL